jgi:hypothetical protein
VPLQPFLLFCNINNSNRHAAASAAAAGLTLASLQGCVLEEYSQGVDEKLRGLELESIQDYIAESDNLVDLHKQVRGGGEGRRGTRWPYVAFRALNATKMQQSKPVRPASTNNQYV